MCIRDRPPTSSSVKKLLASRCKVPLQGGYRPPGPSRTPPKSASGRTKVPPARQRRFSGGSGGAVPPTR
eukprot:1905452-Alexandrium_andersonii.AAC.1